MTVKKEIPDEAFPASEYTRRMPYTKSYIKLSCPTSMLPGAFGVLGFSVFQRGRRHYRDIRRHSIQLFIGAHAGVSAGVGEHRV